MNQQNNAINYNALNFRGLLMYHLMTISRSSTLTDASEQSVHMRGDLDQQFAHSVQTLWAFLDPYTDDVFDDEIESIKAEVDGGGKTNFKAHKELLGCLMKLMHRKQWLEKEDVSAEDEDEREKK